MSRPTPPAYFPRTPAENSYSGRIPSRLLLACFISFALPPVRDSSTANRCAAIDMTDDDQPGNAERLWDVSLEMPLHRRPAWLLHRDAVDVGEGCIAGPAVVVVGERQRHAFAGVRGEVRGDLHVAAVVGARRLQQSRHRTGFVGQ